MIYPRQILTEAVMIYHPNFTERLQWSQKLHPQKQRNRNFRGFDSLVAARTQTTHLARRPHKSSSPDHNFSGPNLRHPSKHLPRNLAHEQRNHSTGTSTGRYASPSRYVQRMHKTYALTGSPTKITRSKEPHPQAAPGLVVVDGFGGDRGETCLSSPPTSGSAKARDAKAVVELDRRSHASVSCSKVEEDRDRDLDESLCTKTVRCAEAKFLLFTFNSISYC
ncbi:hypothetical protein IWX90DRAFT_165927 [Phyllosticta citrichinensis]|uniref:Uncharacterized protein n=1 Tax=Phyllosticta citrichinensis TaxID=1130410 RepID=A0ABR1Y1E6_9PEZI